MNTIANSRISTKRRIRIGSEEHKELFCREFLDTFEPYKPAVIPWPVLDDAALGACYAAVEKDEAYSPQAFVTALKAFKAKVPN